MKRYLSFILAGLVCFLCAGCGKKEGKPIFPDFNPYSVSTIEIRQDDADYLKIFKGEGKDWFVESPGMRFFANYEKIHTFLKLVASLKCVKVPDKQCCKLEKMVQKKGVDVKIEGSNGTISFSLKKAGEDYKSSYIRVGDDKSCLLCSPYINVVVTQPLRKWFKYVIFDDALEDVSAITIEAEGKKVLDLRLQPGDEQWINTSNNKKYSSDDAAKLNEVLTRMSVYGGENPDETYLFDSPVMRINITRKDGRNSYIQISGKKNSSFYYAQRSESETGYLLFPKTWLNKLLNLISDLFDTDIIL